MSTPSSESPPGWRHAPAYREIELPEPPDDRPYVLINMVMSLDGRVVVEETERGLGTATDQRLMRELRSVADMVMNGAETMRLSGSTSRLGDPSLEAGRTARGRPPIPMAAVITRSARLPLDRAFFTARDFDSVVYAAAEAPRDRIAAIEATGRRVIGLPAEGEIAWALGHMRRELGIRVLLVEGGPTLNGQLIDGGLADEFFLTLAPRVVGGYTSLPAVRSDRPSSRDAIRHCTLVNASPNPDTGEIYLRYRFRER